ncbi:hypothetical protein ACFSTC_02570 [Nonomuraea ferruginea]
MGRQGAAAQTGRAGRLRHPRRAARAQPSLPPHLRPLRRGPARPGGRRARAG